MEHTDKKTLNNEKAEFENSLEISGELKSRSRFVDIHCHCLPWTDDGPVTMEESIALCRALVRDRIKTVIATPHQLGQYDKSTEAVKIREKVKVLNNELRKNGIPLSVLPGGDVRVDERICQMIKEDRIITLADSGRYILLELPEGIIVDINPLIIELYDMRIRSVISHPERHDILIRNHQVLFKWIQYGGCIQITAGSLLGRFGEAAKKASWNFLSIGLPVIVATDSHNTSTRSPCMRAAYELIRFKMGEDTAKTVCMENPGRLVEGREVLTLPSRKINMGVYGRFSSIFGKQPHTLHT